MPLDGTAQYVVLIPAEIEEVVPYFLDLRKKNVDEILNALSCGNFEHIRCLGHNIKGSGGSYGFDEISRIGLALEHAAQSGDGNTVRVLARELDDYLERVQVVYDDALKA
jgi:hypothetical protein